MAIRCFGGVFGVSRLLSGWGRIFGVGRLFQPPTSIGPLANEAPFSSPRNAPTAQLAAVAVPAASASSAARCVLSQVNSGSLRPKCPPAAVKR